MMTLSSHPLFRRQEALVGMPSIDEDPKRPEMTFQPSLCHKNGISGMGSHDRRSTAARVADLDQVA